MDAVLSVYHDQVRSAVDGQGPAIACLRAKAQVAHQADKAAAVYLQDLAGELDKIYRTSASKSVGILGASLGSPDVAQVKYMKQNPIGLFGVTVPENESAMNVVAGIREPSPTEQSNGHAKSTILPPEKAKIPKNEAATVPAHGTASSASSSLAKKKNGKNIYYGLTTTRKTSDLVELDEAEAREEKKGFASAHSILSAERVANGKPALPAPGSNKQDKKRKKPASFLDDDDDDDDDDEQHASKPAPAKKKATLHDVTRSVAGKPSGSSKPSNATKDAKDEHAAQLAEEYPGMEPDIIERVLNEILDKELNVTWDDIAGLEDVKQTLKEMIILPNLHPEVFTGLRAPPRGLLLFGPPGNGKTMIAKAIASEAKLTFFSMSASTLCSKWIGEGEKTMRALFAVARKKAPSFIFIDEIDSILSSRGGDEHESSRRLKNEFLVQFDGEDRVTVMGATNRPFDLDEAARRRLPKRIYVPLPEKATRVRLLSHLLRNEKHCLSDYDMDWVSEQLLEGYSCSDIQQLSQQAAMYPVREKLDNTSSSFRDGPLREITTDDFRKAADTTRPSVDQDQCKLYEDFASKFGSRGL